MCVFSSSSLTFIFLIHIILCLFYFNVCMCWPIGQLHRTELRLFMQLTLLISV